MRTILTVSSDVRIDGITPSRRRTIAKSLTLTNPKFLAAQNFSGLESWQIKNVPEKLKLYYEKNGGIYVPRGYEFPEMKSARIIDKRTYAPFEEPLPKCLIEPKSEQKKALDKFYREISDTSNRPFGNFLNVMEVASGKTILAALMARHLKQRTIVFVHTQLIMSAWIADLCKMFGEEYKKNIGVIQGYKAKVGPHFTIAMTQTWAKRKDLWAEWWKFFGVCLMDECQYAPAPSFQGVAGKSPAAYRIGITGTPTRRDGMHKVMYLIFGTPFHKMRHVGLETETSLPIKDVIEVHTTTMLPAKITRIVKGYKDEKTREIVIAPDGQRDYKLVLDITSSDKKRNLLIARKTVQCLMNPSNSVLVVTHRVAHAKALVDFISALWGGDVALLISEENRKEIRTREQALKERRIRCAVATIQLIKTGASIPPLNRLVIATTIAGKGDLEQVIGRIRRKCPGKEDAKVYHLVDINIPMCKRHFNSRALAFYRDRLRVPRYRNRFLA